VRVNNCDVSSSFRINGIAMSVLLYLEGRASRAVCRLVKTSILSFPDAAFRMFLYMCLSLRRKYLSVVHHGCLETSVVPCGNSRVPRTREGYKHDRVKGFHGPVRVSFDILVVGALLAPLTLGQRVLILRKMTVVRMQAQ